LKILIHNHTAVPNGFVTLAPARMEWYSTPPQDMYGQDWFEQLAIHEGRHWAQINRLQVGKVRLFRYVFGEIGWSVGVAQAHPWFLEGDAVVTETALPRVGEDYPRLKWVSEPFSLPIIVPILSGRASLALTTCMSLTITNWDI